MKLKQFKHELRGNYNCDKWAYVMSAWFQVSNELWWRGAVIPAEWGYRPRRATNDPRDKEDEFYRDFKKAKVENLLQIGAFLYRMQRFLDRAGLSY